jgi:heat shock protein HtpX
VRGRAAALCHNRRMARPAAFGKDTGLQARMALTLFFLGLVYVVLVGVLFAAGASGVLILAIAGGLLLFQLFASEAIALQAMGARVVSPQEAPELHAMIERLCVQADLPKPKIAVADTMMPNAFALGRSQKSATVCATTGIMQTLTPAELEGVMAHELSHIANRDVMVMTLAGFFASVASMIVQSGFWFGGGDTDEDGPSWLAVIAIAALVYAISFMLLRALSRYREFAADRGAALLTGRPSALSSALLKISDGIAHTPKEDLRSQGAVSAFYICPATATESLGALFSTHPPLAKRIERLSHYEAQLQGTSR